VCSVLLLTDGLDSSSVSRIKSMEFIEGCSVHCFGFGKDHDAGVLSTIAETAHGTFSFIEKIDTVGPAFATCLGGLLTIVAQNIQVKIETDEQTKVEKVLSHYEHETDKTVTLIRLPDIFAEESRDLLFSFHVSKLKTPQSECCIATASVSYADPKSRGRISLPRVKFFLNRPDSVTAEDKAAVNVILDEQRNRIDTADAIADAISKADKHNYKDAQESLANAINRIESSASSKNNLCKGLMKDLEDCKSRCTESKFKQGGLAFAKSNQMKHKQQRAVYKDEADDEIGAYETSAQTKQKTSYKVYKNSLA